MLYSLCSFLRDSFILCVLENGLERTFFHTDAALDAFILIDNEWSVFVARNSTGRAVLLADAAALAGAFEDDVSHHGFAYAGRTFLVDYVCHVLHL